MIEEWRKLDGFDPRYEVSSLGSIRSITEVNCKCCKITSIRSKILKQRVNKDGYLYLRLSRDGRALSVLSHRIIAVTFVDNPKNKPEVNHINGVKSDNSAINLEWCTRMENMQHAHDTGLMESNYETRQVKVEQLHPVSLNVIAKYLSVSDAAKAVGIHPTGITKVINGSKNTSAGFKWRRI